ncbi:MAG: YhjD/YihY/BrkB family envelope integrity protein [Chloroflexota bacterium]
MLRFFKFFQEIGDRFDQHNGSSYAAAIAYHAIISLGPLLLFSISMASLFFGREKTVNQLIAYVDSLAGMGIGEMLNNVIDELSRPTANNVLFALVTLVLSLYFASNIFRQLVIAQDAIWETERPKVQWEDGLWRCIYLVLRRYIVGLITALVMIFSLLIAMIAGLITDFLREILHIISPEFVDMSMQMGRFGLPVVLVLLCLLTFKLLPSVELTWFDALPGAIITGLLLAGGQQAIGYYANTNVVASFFSVTSSIIILMIWAFFSAFVFLLGVEFTRAFTQQLGSMRPRKLAQKQALTQQ